MQRLSTHNSITKKISEGTHHIKYTLSEYSPIEFDITVVGGQDKTYHKTLTAYTYHFSIDGYGLDKKTVKRGELSRIHFNVKNTGNVRSKFFVRIYQGSRLLKEYAERPELDPGKSEVGFVVTVDRSVVGKFNIKTEVGPYGKSVTDTKTDTLTISVGTAMITFSTTPEHGVSVYVDGVLIGKT